jgi:hypothetical protein
MENDPEAEEVAVHHASSAPLASPMRQRVFAHAFRKFEQRSLVVGVGVFSGVPASVLGKLLPVLLGRRQSL